MDSQKDEHSGSELLYAEARGRNMICQIETLVQKIEMQATMIQTCKADG